MKTKILSLFSVFILLFSVFSFSASADESRIDSSIKAFADNNGKIIGVSSKGEWDEYPENSVPALIEAAKTGIDFVAIDIKKTLDNILVVFSDDTTERMVGDKEIFTISETEYSVLEALKLKNSCGGSNEKATEYKIPTLEEMIAAAKENDIPLILRCSTEIIPEAVKLLNQLDAMSMCIVMTEGSTKSIKAAVSELSEKPLLIGEKKGNVVFNIISFVNTLEEMDAVGVQLNTVNRYGINYYRSLLSVYSEKMRVICDTTTPEISGFREDSEHYWNDLISRGYSVIFTDHAELFTDYKKRTDEATERLQSLYDKYVTNHSLPDFKDEYLSDIKKAYTDAVAHAEGLLGDKSSSLQDLNDCYSKLFKAANDVNINFSSLEDGSAETTVTLPRILLCAAAVVIVIIVQIYFFKRRKKA